MSPLQQAQVCADLREISSVVKTKNQSSNFTFINDAFESDEYQSGQL